MLTLMHHSTLDEVYKGHVDGLAKGGYRNGKDIRVEYQNMNDDRSNLKTMISKPVNDDPTVLSKIATPAAQVLADSTVKTPAVLGVVTGPRTTGLAKSG